MTGVLLKRRNWDTDVYRAKMTIDRPRRETSSRFFFKFLRRTNFADTLISNREEINVCFLSHPVWDL